LSVSRRGKCSEGKAQDCKTLHHSSPFFTCVHSAHLFVSLRAADRGERGFWHVASSFAASIAASEFSSERQGKSL
jgi:hypothetical protein